MLLEYIKSDLYRYAGKVSFKQFFKHYFLTLVLNICFTCAFAKA